MGLVPARLVVASFSLALAACLATGCATTKGEARAASGDPEAHFLTEAAHGSNNEVALSRIALERAQDPRVRQYAQMMVSDHNDGNRQLVALGQSKGMNLPMRPDELHVKTATYLRQLNGQQFDQEYMGCMVADHAKMLTQFQNKVARSRDEQVRQWASSQVPVLRSHLEQARDINMALGGNFEQMNAQEPATHGTHGGSSRAQ